MTDLTFGSVCSGIEAATVAWKPLGWRCAFVSEIEPFPCAVLKHHYPDVPNFGDMTKFKDWPDAKISVLVGGTPCQSFSVAGLRKGLDDPRGNLTLTYLAVAAKYRPEWLVWENVPGVLSDATGAFGAFLGGLAELGYGFAYRILDAQYFGVAQRRRRVFVVGCIGDWRRAAAVLFERHSLQGHPAPSREAGKEAAEAIAKSLRGRSNSSHREDSDNFIASVAGALDTECGGGKMTHQTVANGHLIGTITARMFKSLVARDVEEGALLPVTHALRGEGFDASEDGTGRGTPLVPIAFSAKDYGADAGELAPTLRAGGHTNSHANAGCMPAIAFGWQNSSQQGASASASHTPTLDKSKVPAISSAMAVRRLVPEECEALQGFPRGYTQVPHRNKPAADGPRYKALGNSIAVPVMRWLGERIAMVNELPND